MNRPPTKGTIVTAQQEDRDSRDELLTITEAAELLRSPVATLRYWRHLGTGPHSFKIGRKVMYWRTDLRAWVDAQSGREPA